MIRLTADIDSKNIFEVAWYFYKALKHVKGIKQITVEPSHSKGYHMTLWSSFNYSKAQQYKLRKVIGDDNYRIRMDKLRKVGKNTLFNKKQKLKLK